MGRMPIHDQIALLATESMRKQSLHAVLIQVSLGYPPVMGRLHTRYAPVRHSPSPRGECCRPTCMY